MKTPVSDKTIRIGAMFQIAPEYVYEAMLLACGCSQEEAGAVVYGSDDCPTLGSLRMRESRRIRESSGIADCAEFFRNSKIRVSQETIQNITDDRKRKRKRSDENYTNKDFMLNELWALSKLESDPTKRAAILKQIADLQQMKRDENVAEEKLVHFFLPLNCKRCSLYVAEKKRKEGNQ